MKFPALIARNTSRRWWAAAILLSISVTPFWRGGRDGEGYLVLAFGLFLAWLAWQRYPRTKHKIPGQLLVPLSLLTVWLLVSSVWATDSFPATLRVLTILFAANLFVLANQLATKKLDRTRLRQLVIIGSAPVMGFGLYLYFARVYDRAASFLYAPNAYALYLLIIWILLLYEYRRTKHWLAAAGLLAVVSQFLLIQSIATMALGLVITMLLMSQLRFTKKQVLTVGVIILLGLVVAIGLIQSKTELGSGNVGTPDEAAELVETKVSGVASRFSYWQATGDIYLDNPVIGVGADNFQNAYPEYQEDPSLATENPHNFILQTYAEAGVIGGTLLLVVLAVIGRMLWQNRSNAEATAYGAILVAILLHASFYQTSRYPVFWLTFVFILALMLAAVANGREMPVPRNVSTLLTALALLLILPAGFYYRSDSFADTGFDYNRQRNIVDSSYYLTEASKLPIMSPRVNQTLAIQNTFAGEFELALESAQSAVASDDSGQSYGALAYVLQQSGAPNTEIAAAYETAIIKDPFNSIDTYINYSRYLIDQNRFERAQQIFDFILPYYEDEDLPRIIQFGDLPRRVALLTFQQARLGSITGNDQLEIESLQRTVQLYPEYQQAQSILERRLLEIQ